MVPMLLLPQQRRTNIVGVIATNNIRKKNSVETRDNEKKMEAIDGRQTRWQTKDEGTDENRTFKR